MLDRSAAKTALILLLSLTLPAFILTLTTLIVTLAKQYVGFMLDSTTPTYVCSVYLTLKLQTFKISILNVSFICGCIALLAQALMLVQLFYLLVLYCQNDNLKYMEFTYNSCIRLYLGYSLALLGTMVGFGYFLTYLVEEGINCLSYIYNDWVVFIVLLGLALLLLLICWIYLFCLKTSIMDCEEQINRSKQQYYDQSINDNIKAFNKKTERQPLLPQQTNNQSSSSSHDSDMIQEPDYMAYLHSQIKKEKENDSIKESLVEEIQSQDRYSQDEQIKKIACIPFEEYLMKKQKDEEKARKKQLEKEEEEKKKKNQRVKASMEKLKKERLNSIALSPNDPNFHLIFEEEPEPKKANQDIPAEKPPQQKGEEEEYYPGNFSPANEKELKKYLAYRKRQQNKGKPKGFKHPQNIQGGRSKRMMKKYIEQSKRPVRNEESFWLSRMKKSEELQQDPKEKVPPIQEEQFSSSEESSEQSSEPAASSEPSNPQAPKILTITPPPRPIRVEQIKQRQSQHDSVCFHKEKVHQKKRKQLFQPQFTMNQALKLIVKGVEAEALKKRARQNRQRQTSVYLGKKGQKLIDSIRSTFD